MSDLAVESTNKKRGLGRGLGSLLGGDAQATAVNAPTPPKEAPLSAEGKVWQIAIEKIKPGLYQPRRIFSKESIEELAQSIRESGLLQPIIVRKSDDANFEIIAGERRWRAAQLAGLHQIPAIIKGFDDRQALELAIIENVQREDLSPLEEAEGYFRLIQEFKLTHQEIAQKVGKDRTSISNALRLLSLPSEVREMIDQKTLSVGHAKALLAVSDSAKLVSMAREAVQGHISVRQLEKLLKSAEQESASAVATASDDSLATKLAAGLAEELQKQLSTKVLIDYKSGKGKLTIHFYSDEELTALVDKLKEA